MSSTTAAASAGSHDLARIRQACATADLGMIAYETQGEEDLVVEEEILSKSFVQVLVIRLPTARSW